jgi:hypothetical protein
MMADTGLQWTYWTQGMADLTKRNYGDELSTQGKW